MRLCEYMSCGKPARIFLKFGTDRKDKWFCAEHYDRYIERLRWLRDNGNCRSTVILRINGL
jgi:hypothetical protein